MAKKSLSGSNGKSEKWFVEHPAVADRLVKEGVRGAVPTRNVSIRLPVTDIERAQQLAAARGVPWQTLVKALLHDCLLKEVGATSPEAGGRVPRAGRS
jgi:hypothetical protein